MPTTTQAVAEPPADGGSSAPPAGDRPDDGQTGRAEAEAAGAEGHVEPGDDELVQALAALLFASPEPLSEGRLAELSGAGAARVRRGLEALEERLASAGLPFRPRSLAGGWTLMTRPELADTVARLVKNRSVERVSAAGLETLAVVAYRQPVTKAEIEAIRGVQAGPILRSLVDRGLVRVVGRADVPGHPLQYGTTRLFLDRFGLGGLDDLPRDGELARD